jgi:hypothetical protein
MITLRIISTQTQAHEDELLKEKLDLSQTKEKQSVSDKTPRNFEQSNKTKPQVAKFGLSGAMRVLWRNGVVHMPTPS